jgi:hypothetical protein
MIHRNYCRQRMINHSDAAQRVADTYNNHLIGTSGQAIGRWFAARLEDGTTDKVLYDTKAHAVRHQKGEENWYTYIKINAGSMTVCDAEIMLRVARAAYDRGMRLADPEHAYGGRDIIKRVTAEDMKAQAQGFSTNLYIPGRNDQ